MADIKISGSVPYQPAGMDMDALDLSTLGAPWALHGYQFTSTSVSVSSDWDPYGGSRYVLPAWRQMNLLGDGFAAPDAASLPTVGHVTTLVVFAANVSNMAIEIYGLDQPVAPLLSAIHQGHTSDILALLTSGDDRIQGGNANMSIFNYTGDVIRGGLGDDTIVGHGGGDTLSGGAGNDLFSTVDHTTAAEALGSVAHIDGGPGFNSITYEDAPGPIVADLSGAAGGTDVLTNIQGVTGSVYADRILGTAANEKLVGGGGEDTVTGGAGDDTLDAGVFWGDVSASRHVILWGGDGNDLIHGDLGFNQVNGNAGNDTIEGRSEVGDWLLGGQGDDFITAAYSGRNIMNGNLGNDVLYGSYGPDTIRGGQGADYIQAGDGADLIFGDLGRNTLTGAEGADTFVAGAGQDVITDFNPGEGDRILVAAKVTWHAVQSGADVVINFSTGGDMTLQGVSLPSLGAGWLVAA